MKQKIIWTNGCFDILHKGHIELFRYAKSLGDKLIVGIDSDERVKLDKGEDRPINKLSDRMSVLSAIKYVDMVLPFNSTEELEIKIKYWSPTVMVIGSDWKGKKVVGEEHAGKVELFDRIEGYSTTKLLNKDNKNG